MIRFRLLILIGVVSSLLLILVWRASAVDAAVGFVMLPISGPIGVGTSFTVTIQVQTQGQSIDGAEIHVDYDPALLEVVSTQPGTALPVTLRAAKFDNTTGKMGYAAGTFSNFPKASFDLLTITFKAKAAGTSVLRLPVSAVPRHSDLTFAGASLINITAPIELGSITINSASIPTPSPAPVGPTLSVRSEPNTATLAQPVNVHIELTQVQNLYGLEMTCTVDPTVLIGTEHVDGTVFKAANSFFVDQGFQLDGHWNIAASLLSPAPVFAGDGTAFDLHYLVSGTGSTAINCQATAVNADGFTVPITVVNGTFANGSAPAKALSAPAALSSITQAPALAMPNPASQSEATTQLSASQPNMVQGDVRYQAQPDSSGIKLTLLAGGTTGTPLGEAQTNSDGAFQFNDLKPGVYALQISGEGHLPIIKTFSVTETGATPLEITLRAGDTNGDQRIDLSDAALVGANFSSTVPPSPAVADLNHDGVINISDLVLIGGNFGLVGPMNE